MSFDRCRYILVGIYYYFIGHIKKNKNNYFSSKTMLICRIYIKWLIIDSQIVKYLSNIFTPGNLNKNSRSLYSITYN